MKLFADVRGNPITETEARVMFRRDDPWTKEEHDALGEAWKAAKAEMAVNVPGRWPQETVDRLHDRSYELFLKATASQRTREDYSNRQRLVRRGINPGEQMIHLTDRPAVLVSNKEWPILAEAEWHDGDNSEVSAARRYVRVRQHKDGRALIYGLHVDGRFEQKIGFIAISAKERDEAVRKACALVDLDPQKVFDDMPVEKL